MSRKLSILTLVLVLYTIMTLPYMIGISSFENDNHGRGSYNAYNSHKKKHKQHSYTMRHEIDPNDLYELQHTFPVNVFKNVDKNVTSLNMEYIDHPGKSVARNARKGRRNGMEKRIELPQMKVPKFWNPTDVFGEYGVRHFLGENGKRLPTMDEFNTIGSYDENGHETIYVYIASYRDPECTPTIESLYTRAKYPERIRVGVIDQRQGNDPYCGVPMNNTCADDPNQPTCRYNHLIDVMETHAPYSVGPVFARHLAQRLYRGEYFILQLDAHARFVRDWDVDIINQWKSIQNEMAVISYYMDDVQDHIDPVDFKRLYFYSPIMCKTQFEQAGKLKHLRQPAQPVRTNDGEYPQLHVFFGAGFAFARGHFLIQVPYDQYGAMVFQGEEANLAVRAFTYGYDLYTPGLPVAFHIYASGVNKAERLKVRRFNENKKFYAKNVLGEGSKRINGVIGMGYAKEDFYRVEEDKYGIGNIRTTDKFYKLFGIDPIAHEVKPGLCNFVLSDMHPSFTKFLRNDTRGIDYNQIDFEYGQNLKPKRHHRGH